MSGARRIRRRLALASSALALGCAGAALALVWWQSVGELDRAVDTELEGELRGLVDHLARFGRAGLRQEVRRRSGSGDVYYVLAESYLERIEGNLERWPQGLSGHSSGETVDLVPPRGLVQMSRRVRVEARTLSHGERLLVGRDVTEQERLAREVRFALAGAFGLSVALAIAGGLSISRGLLGRVERMRATIVHILGGGRSERVAVGARPDEFDELAVQFNRLLDENERVLARMREVTHDVAHDLRTPLARMRRRIEADLATPGDREQLVETLHQLRADSDHILETFNAMLQIAQVETAAAREAMEPVALAALVHDAVELYGPLAEERGIALRSDADAALVIRGNRHLLAQALVNLIDNALKYGAAPGEVWVRARRGDRGSELWVSDQGPGIPEADRGRVLERFVRLDASRAKPGTGLGLSFVAAVAELHGAELVLSDAAPGLAVALRFPDRA